MSPVASKRSPATRLQPLSALALGAATELDARIGTSMGSSDESTRALAQELLRLFPGQRPNLPPEMIGLVCGVIEDWVEPGTEPGYNQSTQAAKKIADLLQKPKLSKRQIEKLVQFCLSLYYATQPRPMMHDMPEDHRDFLSMA